MRETLELFGEALNELLSDMNFQEAIGLAQGAAITVAFLFITAKLPALLQSYWNAKIKLAELQGSEQDKHRDYEANERRQDRESRHAAVQRFQDGIREMFLDHRGITDRLTQAVNDMRVTLETSCRYRGSLAHASSDDGQRAGLHGSTGAG